jgi:hypothetical protein
VQIKPASSMHQVLWPHHQFEKLRIALRGIEKPSKGRSAQVCVDITVDAKEHLSTDKTGFTRTPPVTQEQLPVHDLVCNSRSTLF